MAVTNNIRDKVVFYNDEEKINHDNKTWDEVKLTNEEIIDKLNEEKKESFLSFAYRSLVYCLSEEIIFYATL